MKKTFSRALSVFLTLLIVVMSAPFVFAAEPITLSKSNVVTWPTVSGTCYFGQKIGDALTLEGGEVQYNGETVSGKFVFADPNKIPGSTGSKVRADLTFEPTNSDVYSGFSVSRSRDVTYAVLAGKLILADENNPPVVVDEVEAGTVLSSLQITGGQVVNAYNAEETNALTASWSWSDPTAVVYESGTFEASISVSNYETLTYPIQVNLKSIKQIPTISENPVVEIEYTPNATWGDITLNGGKAVITNDDGTTSEVAGTFNVADSWKTTTITASCTEIGAVFTPDDTDTVMEIDFKLPVTVNKAVPAFKTDDESGVPTITMPYGTKLDSSLDYKIKPLIDVGVPVSLAYKDLDGNNLSYSGTTPVVGTHEIQVRVNIDNTNYEQFTMLTFNLEITGFTANCIMVPVGTEGYKIIDESLAYNAAKPTGTFTVSYTINGEKQTDKTVKYGELFQVEKTKSGKYEFSIKYNKTENDPFEIADITYTGIVVLSHNVTINGQKQTADYNTTVTASAPATDPAQPDKPYYGFTNWEAKGIDISEEQAASPEFSFTMPDNEVELKANYKFSIKLFFEWVLAQITQFFTFIVNAVKDLIALA